MSKQYKNIYTILEKVKKGEIKSYYNTADGGLFGKMNFYKKPDLIKQSLHYLDEDRLSTIMTTNLQDTAAFTEIYSRFAKSSKFKSSSKSDFATFMNEVRIIYQKHFPKHLLYDIYKMYYNKIERLDFEDRTDKNQSKFKFLEISNNPVGKVMSENSQLKSAVFSRSVVNYFLSQLAIAKICNLPNADQALKSLNGKGDEFDEADSKKAIDDIFNDKSSKDDLNDIINQAQSLCNKLDSAMTDEQQDQMFEQCDKVSSEAGKLNSEFITNAAAKITKIKMSMSGLKEKIKKLMDKSKSYFSAKEETIYEDLFNADSIAGLEEFELLHPSLRKVMAEDIMIKETKKIGKIDIYVDVSGSMNSSCGIKIDDQEITKLDFCKSFLFQMKQLDVLNDVFLFNDKVKESKSDPITIAMINESGGTNIDKAIESINKKGANAIIIKEYVEKDQVVVFDGNKIQKVNQEGVVIQ